MRAWFWLGLMVACEAGSVQIAEDPQDAIDPDTDVAPDPDPERDFSCEPFGLSVEAAATVDHGSLITAWSGPEAVILPTTFSINSRAECAFDLRQGFVAADVQVGPGGYPDEVICRGRTSDLDGEEGILEASVELAARPLPTGLPESSGDKVLEWGDAATFTVDRRLDALSVRTNAELIIDGDIDLHVTGDVEFNRGSLMLTEGSELDLWVDGSLDAVWESKVNAGGDAGALRIHVAGGSVRLDQRSQVTGRLRAPDSEVSIKGRATTWTGTVQADTLDVIWGGRISVPDELLCED